MISKKIKTIRICRKTSLVVLLIGVLTIASLAPKVTADRFDDQIKQLQQQNAQNQSTVSQLQQQATSYQDAISRLQVQINALQVQINDNLAKQADLQQKIEANQRELDHQRSTLGENIKVMYMEGDISMPEMLASSKNLSDFVDKEEYRTAIENKIQDTMKKIAELQNQQKEQKTEAEHLLAEQKSQQNQVVSSRAEQSRLLGFNQQQQADYNAQVKDNQTKIAQLRSQQAAENAKLFAGAKIVVGGSCDTAKGDTYPTPWCNSTQDSILDYWGMYNRECVSYTAWKVHESGRHMPAWGSVGLGNANQWDDDAIAEGIPVDSTPRAGDVAIKNSYPYGHAMYVESVNSDGTMNISQYNSDYSGHFSRVYNMSTSGLVFVHFP
jgi:surface antigen